MKIHYTGRIISQQEVDENPYLQRYKRTVTLYGYIFFKEDKVTITSNKKRVDCKLCIKKLETVK